MSPDRRDRGGLARERGHTGSAHDAGEGVAPPEDGVVQPSGRGRRHPASERSYPSRGRSDLQQRSVGERKVQETLSPPSAPRGKRLLPLPLGLPSGCFQTNSVNTLLAVFTFRCPQAVCSTSNEKAVTNLVKTLMGQERLERIKIFAGDVVARKKPNPDIYDLAKVGYSRPPF